MKIYTKTGDKGTTALFGGGRLSKAHLRIESYGNVDELNSYIGLIRDLINLEDVQSELTEIQNTLFTIGSHLAADPNKKNLWLPDLKESDIQNLEKSIDIMQSELPALTHFILPGGHSTVSHCHIARCVCRRAERAVVQLSDNEKINDLIIQYLNRLSDYLFVLSRYISLKVGVDEIKWDSGRG